MPSHSTCRRCGAPIQWALTMNGKAMPLDLKPSSAGNIELRQGVAHVLSKPNGTPLLTPHFATCKESKR